MENYSLSLYDSPSVGGQPLVIGIDPAVNALDYSTGIGGGYINMHVGVTQPEQRSLYGNGGGYLSRPISIKPFALVILRHGQQIVWRGRVMEIVLYEGRIRGFVADGLGIVPQGAPWFSASAVATTTQGILTMTQPTCAPLLSPGNSDVYTDPGNTHTPAEFDGMNWQAIVEQLAKEANYMYLVYDAGIEFRSKIAPASPDYRIGLAGVETTQNYRGVRGAGRIRYTEAGVETTYPTTGNAPLSNAAFADRYGELIETLLSSDQLTTAAATAFLTTYIANHIEPEIGVSIARFTTLTRVGGTPELGAFVRAGKWIQIADQPMQLILATRHDAMTGQTDATIGAIPPRSYLSQFVNVQQPVEKIVAGLSAGPAGGKRK